MSIRNSYETNGNRIHDLRVCHPNIREYIISATRATFFCTGHSRRRETNRNDTNVCIYIYTQYITRVCSLVSSHDFYGWFEVFAMDILKIQFLWWWQVFRLLIPCVLKSQIACFQGHAVQKELSDVAVKMKAIQTSKVSGNSHPLTQYNPEDLLLK